MFKKSPAKIFGIALLVILAISAFGAITMLLWNWLIPAIFNGPSVTYFQALGLLVLCKILFSVGPGKHEKHPRTYSHQLPWKKHLWERMEDGADHNAEDSSPESASTVTSE